MAAIKKFFEKRKLNIKFKKAGEGHKLNESPSASSTLASASVQKPTYSKDPQAATHSKDPQAEAARRAAAEAAQARFEAKQHAKQGMLLLFLSFSSSYSASQLQHFRLVFPQWNIGPQPAHTVPADLSTTLPSCIPPV